MNQDTNSKMRRTEIITGIALSAVVIIDVLSYFTDKFFSFPNTLISSVSFVSLLIASVLFVIGIFRKSPARYIVGALFILTALSGIWMIAVYISWFGETSYFLKWIISWSVLAAGSVICALTYFGVIRFRKKRRSHSACIYFYFLAWDLADT